MSYLLSPAFRDLDYDDKMCNILSLYRQPPSRVSPEFYQVAEGRVPDHVDTRHSADSGPLVLNVTRVAGAAHSGKSMCAHIFPHPILFIFYFILIPLIADGPHHYHPACGHKGSSHLSPVHALQFSYRDASSALLQLVNQWLNWYLLTFPRFPLRKKEHKSYFGKNRTHDFRTSRCAAYLLDYSGDNTLAKCACAELVARVV